jgi:hypothetical protein
MSKRENTMIIISRFLSQLNHLLGSSFSIHPIVPALILTTFTSGSPGSLSPKQKRGRLLIRQPRLKKDSNPLDSDPEDSSSPQPSTSFASNYLQVPHMRVERQASEPCPGKSLLQVPPPAYLTKQHSQPLLPSQQSKPLTIKSSILLRQATMDMSTEVGQPSKEQLPILRVTPESTEPLLSRGPARREPIKRAVSTPVNPTSDTERLGHCPLLRPGPALGCNFCWNTIDQHNRILRRKTKYYCPECQTNLCIVPCFQEYHQKFDRHAASSPSIRIISTTSLAASSASLQTAAASSPTERSTSSAASP